MWVLTMRARGLAPRTVTERERTLRVAARRAGEPPLTFTTEGAAVFLASIDTQATRRVYYVTIKNWTTWLVQTGRRRDDPLLMLPAPKVPRYEPHPVTTHQLEVLLRSRMHRRTRAMILLAAYEGLRVHEVAKVRGDDVDLDARTLRVVGKGGVTATLPLHQLVVDVAAGFPERGWWFPAYTAAGAHISGRSITATISAAMRRSGIRSSAHSLRHWYGTELVRSGADLRTTQTLLRHSSLATTAVYTAVADETRAIAVAALPDATRARLHVVPRPGRRARVTSGRVRLRESSADLRGILMKRSSMVLAAAGLAVGLTACGGSSGSSSDAATTAAPAASPPSTAAPSPSTSKPLSFYAAQYLAAGKACEADQGKLNDLIGQTPQNADAIEKEGSTTASDCQSADAKLLRESWPPGVLSDIKAEATADGPVIGDLNDLESAGESNIQRDSGAANAATNIVRADLGLPALK